jgi:GTP:adenosylcobinamide-phosphate guanylyltransferase
MDALVLAGGIPQPDDPLYTYSNGDSKALIDVAGKPMVQWVLDALGDSNTSGMSSWSDSRPGAASPVKSPCTSSPTRDACLPMLFTGVNKTLELNRKTQYVLVVSSDIPALKPEMVDWLVETCMETKDDLYYGICTRDVMEGVSQNRNGPTQNLKGMELCGADINVTHVRMATEHLDLWESLIGTRKSPLRQAGIIGLGTLWPCVHAQHHAG